MKKYCAVFFSFTILVLTIGFGKDYVINMNSIVYCYSGLSASPMRFQSTPVVGMKTVPVLSNEKYAKVHIGGEDVYVVIGKEGYSPVLYVSQGGYFSDANRVTILSPSYTSKTDLEECWMSEPVNLHFYWGVYTLRFQFSHVSWKKFNVKKGSMSFYSYFNAAQRVGYFKLNGVEHKLFLSNLRPTGTYDKLSNDILGVDTYMGSIYGYFQNLRGNDEVSIGGKKFKITQITPSGDRIYLEEVGTSTAFFKIGDKISNFSMGVLGSLNSTEVRSVDLKDFKDKYVLFYVWTPNVLKGKADDFTLEINKLYEQYKKKGLVVIGLGLRFSNQTSSTLYKMMLKILLQDSKISFIQLTPTSSEKVAKDVLHLPAYGSLCLVGPGSVILYRTTAVWSSSGVLRLNSVSFVELKNILNSLLK